MRGRSKAGSRRNVLPAYIPTISLGSDRPTRLLPSATRVAPLRRLSCGNYASVHGRRARPSDMSIRCRGVFAVLVAAPAEPPASARRIFLCLLESVSLGANLGALSIRFVEQNLGRRQIFRSVLGRTEAADSMRGCLVPRPIVVAYVANVAAMRRW